MWREPSLPSLVLVVSSTLPYGPSHKIGINTRSRACQWRSKLNIRFGNQNREQPNFNFLLLLKSLLVALTPSVRLSLIIYNWIFLRLGPCLLLWLLLSLLRLIYGKERQLNVMVILFLGTQALFAWSVLRAWSPK